MVRQHLASVALVGIVALACVENQTSPTPPTPQFPNYAGTWTGSYTITSCNQTGTIAIVNNICGALGQSAAFTFRFQQNGSLVTGNFSLGTITFPNISSTMGSNGTLPVTSTTLNNGVTVQVTWSLQLPVNSNQLTGNVNQTWVAAGLTGDVEVAGRVSTATRTSVALVPPSVGAGEFFV